MTQIPDIGTMHLYVLFSMLLSALFVYVIFVPINDKLFFGPPHSFTVMIFCRVFLSIVCKCRGIAMDNTFRILLHNG